VFVLDKKAYYPDGLHIAQSDACSYVHVHGPEIFAVVPDAHLYITMIKTIRVSLLKRVRASAAIGNRTFV
jgi:hypothetical protein